MSTDKPWDRPWSMDEIIENADNWSLAGDVALLNILKSFSDNLLTRTTEINNNLQNLTSDLDNTSLQLDIAQNEFRSLRNSQFIESRVYEDDESLPNQEVENKSKNEEVVNDHSEEIKTAALKGLEVLDEYFDKIEVSVSDSEDEDIDLPNYVLRLKDLYIHRPLPYVIGSDEWHKNWHVGLDDSSTDSETEKVSDKFSESDSESDLPIIQDNSQIKDTSDTSSDLDFSQKVEPKLKHEFFSSSESENSIPAQGTISNTKFAEELTAKLGHVIQNAEEPEVNTRPIQKQKSNVFFDEPPPLDEPKGIFSGGSGLFDDDDDISYKSSKTESPKVPKNVNIFDGGDSSDDDIFAKKPQPAKTALFNDEPPVLDEKKKPIGGVSIFGGGNLFDKKLLKRQPSSDDDDDNTEKGKVEVEKKKVSLFDDDDLFKNVSKDVRSTNTKKINLFDDDENETKGLFSDDVSTSGEQSSEDKIQKDEKRNDIFSEETSENKPAKKFTLFDDKTEKDEKKNEIFSEESSESKPEKKFTLFDDDLFKDDLFSTNTTKSFTSGLFDDMSGDDLFSSKSEDKPKSSDLFSDVSIPDNKNSINVVTKENSSEASTKSENTNTTKENNLYNSDLETQPKLDGPKPPVPKPRLSFFDSPPPETDDLFKVEENSELFSNTPPENDIVSSTPQITPNSVPTMRLFDPNPPPDDEWDPKSENSEKSALFDEEPPSLEPQTEPIIKNKPGKLKHNLNIDVGALLPGSLPPKLAEKPPPDINEKVPTSPTDVATSFDDADNVKILHSVTKDRARVPLKRRPSTRSGRKAALKNSSSDFKLNQESTDDSETVEKPTEQPKSETVEKPTEQRPSEVSSLFETETKKTSLLFEPSDDLFGDNSLKFESMPALSDNLFGESKADLKSLPLFGESEANSKNPPKIESVDIKTDLLGNSEDEGSSLFASKDLTEVKPMKSDKPSSNLFDDDDDDDDLFTPKKPIQKTKKSLFEDDDDDDIFKSFSSANVKKTETKVATEKKLPKVTSIKKLENTKPDDDPLSALLK